MISLPAGDLNVIRCTLSAADKWLTGVFPVNGSIDLADAVYLLSYLFAQGPAPEVIECPPPAGCALPATGQTKWYGMAGGEIDCESSGYPGQDAFFMKGCPVEERFVDSGDGTMTDSCTGLMWQKETAEGMLGRHQERIRGLRRPLAGGFPVGIAEKGLGTIPEHPPG